VSHVKPKVLTFNQLWQNVFDVLRAIIVDPGHVVQQQIYAPVVALFLGDMQGCDLLHTRVTLVIAVVRI